MARLEKMRGEVRRAYRDQCHSHNHSWRSQCDRQTARVLWSKPIDKPEEKQNADCGERNVILEKLQPEDVFCAGNDVGQTGPTTKRCGHGKIRDEQQRTDNGKQSSLRARRGINAPAIGKIAADDSVVDSHKSREHANREDDRERRKTRGEKSKADDIGFARAPVTVKQRGRTLPIQVARTVS